MSSYSFSEEAIQDLNEICEYIAYQNSNAAIKLFETIRAKCKSVADFPNLGKRYNYLLPNLRGFIINDYIVFYLPKTDGIDVVRVVSGRRNLENIFADYEKKRDKDEE